jgi:protease I
MNKKALIITWNGYQDQEVIYPYYRLLESEFETAILAEEPGWIYGILGTKMKATLAANTLNKENVNNYDFLLLPGGVKALEKIRQQKNILEFIAAFVDTGKIVASTCH